MKTLLFTGVLCLFSTLAFSQFTFTNNSQCTVEVCVAYEIFVNQTCNGVPCGYYNSVEECSTLAPGQSHTFGTQPFLAANESFESVINLSVTDTNNGGTNQQNHSSQGNYQWTSGNDCLYGSNRIVWLSDESASIELAP